MDNADIEIKKGFFWFQKIDKIADKTVKKLSLGGNIIIYNPNITMIVHENVFMTKPRWYELRKWWVAFNIWRKM